MALRAPQGSFTIPPDYHELEPDQLLETDEEKKIASRCAGNSYPRTAGCPTETPQPAC